MHITESFAQSGPEGQLPRKGSLSIQERNLDFLWLELTNRCNLQCIHCYTESNPYSGDRDLLTKRDYESLMTQARELGCRKIQFIGGEPQLNPHFQTLLRHAKTVGASISSKCSATLCGSRRIQSATPPPMGFASPPRSIPLKQQSTTLLRK
jgi:sulfatase maturation enzyme AslB (radical SAM superfamily)